MEAIDVNATGHHGKQRSLTDPQSKMLLLFRLRERNHTCGPERQQTLDLQKTPGGQPAKMTVKHVAMGGVHDDGNPRNPGGQPPRITSPLADVVYSIRARALGKQDLSFSANADAGADRLHWFVGAQYVGRSPPGEALAWRAEPGDYLVRVVDDAGRSDSVPIAVAVVE